MEVRGRFPTADALAVSLVYGGYLAVTARELGCDPMAVRLADPRRRATANAEWMRAARCRRIAIYLTSVTLDARQARIADVLGLSRQAVNQAMRDISDERDDAEFDALLRRIETLVTGEAVA